MFVVVFLFVIFGAMLACFGGLFINMSINSVFYYGKSKVNTEEEKNKNFKMIKTGAILLCLGLLVIAIGFYLSDKV